MVDRPNLIFICSDRQRVYAEDQRELFDLDSNLYEEVHFFNDPVQRGQIQRMAAKTRLCKQQAGYNTPPPSV